MRQQSPGLFVVELPPAYARLDFSSAISSGLMEDVIAHIRRLPRSTPVAALFVGDGFTDDSP